MINTTPKGAQEYPSLKSLFRQSKYNLKDLELSGSIISYKLYCINYRQYLYALQAILPKKLDIETRLLPIDQEIGEKFETDEFAVDFFTADYVNMISGRTSSFLFVVRFLILYFS